MTGKREYRLNRCVFEATLACNLNCRHCGSRAGRARDDELSTAEAADLFAQLAGLGCQRVTISGGEAMIRDDWPDLIEAAATTGMKVGLITNGVLFTDDAAQIARDSGLGAVGFSVDGIGQTNDRLRGRIGHFQMVENAISSAKRTGLRFAVITQINRLNLGELEGIHDFVRDRGAYAWQVQPGTEMGNLADNRDLLLRPRDLVRVESIVGDLIRRDDLRISACNSLGYFGPYEKLLRRNKRGRKFSGCPAGVRTLGIESNGNVKGCLSILPGEGEDSTPYIEGNIREETLESIWNQPGAFSYNRDWTLGDLGGFCRECKQAKRCRGGCTANRVASGDANDNEVCVYRAIFEEEPASQGAAKVAAIAFSALLGAAVGSCDSDDDDFVDGGADYDDDDPVDGGADAGSDADSDADSDSDVDTDVDGDSDAYDIPPWT